MFEFWHLLSSSWISSSSFSWQLIYVSGIGEGDAKKHIPPPEPGSAATPSSSLSSSESSGSASILAWPAPFGTPFDFFD
jgi:hypothetical protein